MSRNPPHLFQYQGSKRRLAPLILRHMPARFGRLIEPFAGAAAISLACAHEERTGRFLLNDINRPLVALLAEAVREPERLAENYRRLWSEQFASGDHAGHYYSVRENFNNGDARPEHMLYLLARCVKGSVRYGKSGKFNQSPDKRRHGTRPEAMAANIRRVSALLKGRTEFRCLDYREILGMAGPGDLVYMDPPYQGVCGSGERRYLSGIDSSEFIGEIDRLNRKGIDFIISYDGQCGDRKYGEELPAFLNREKIILDAGRSSQATLLGERALTRESLYISRGAGVRAASFKIKSPEKGVKADYSACS